MEEEVAPMTLKTLVTGVFNFLMKWGTIISLMVLSNFNVIAACSVGMFMAIVTLLRTRWQFKRGEIKVFPKVLDAGLLIVICAMLPVALTSPNFVHSWNGAITDGALAAVVLVSLIIDQPFTRQYAKDKAPEEYWTHPIFVNITAHLAWVWFFAFVTLALINGLPRALGASDSTCKSVSYGGLGVLALCFHITTKYPDWYKARHPELFVGYVLSGDEVDVGIMSEESEYDRMDSSSPLLSNNKRGDNNETPHVYYSDSLLAPYGK